MEFSHTACLGGGVIGGSWAALFLASGRKVSLFDPAPGAEDAVRAYIDNAWPTLVELGLAESGDPGRLSFHASAAEAVEGADFIQENVPERIEVKHAIFAEIEPALGPSAIVSSSASGLTLGQMQAGWQKPERFVLGHPFNPPHLIPLVEIMANERTEDGVIEAAERFYEAVGKVTIRVRKEVAGHVANRLQAAIWREAVSMVMQGVASVEDVDKAIWAGPGLRWAAMGPTMLFNLGAGEKGLRGYLDHFAETYNGWWEDLGQVRITEDVIETLVAGVREEAAGLEPAELSARRDAMVLAIRKAIDTLRPAA